MSTGAFVAGGIRGTKEQDGRTAGRQEEEGGGQNSHAVPVIPSGGGRRWRWRLWWVCEGGGGDVNVSKRRKKVKEAGKQEVRMRVRCGGGWGLRTHSQMTRTLWRQSRAVVAGGGRCRRQWAVKEGQTSSWGGGGGQQWQGKWQGDQERGGARG